MTVVSSRYLLRPMTVADIPRVSEIERESFPTMWPQTAYKRELERNNLAAYLVVCELTGREEAGEEEMPSNSRPALPVRPRPQTAPAQTAPDRGARGLARRLQSLFGRGSSTTEPAGAPPAERIAGFVGIWFMVDEAHIVTIAVAEAERRRGLGEMLLIAAIELAQRREQEVVTLECRQSNFAAQALYEKYGFRRVGIRKRYYSDNNEDAIIMTTMPVQSDAFNAQFGRLCAAHAARHGTPQIAHLEL